MLEQHGVEAQHRQFGLDRDLDTVPGQHVPRPLQCRTDDLGDIEQFELQLDGTGFDTGHVEKVGDEPVQALGFVLQGGQQFLALGGTVPFRKAAQARHGAEDRGQRCAQIVRDRGQQRGTQPLGLGKHPRLVEPLGERDALDRHRPLIA